MKQHLKNKIVIIGAGPAGTTTALFLAQKKIHTIIVDKAIFPRHKACADNITGGALRILNELDASWIQKFQTDKLSKSINGITAYAPNGHHFDIDFMPLESGTTDDSCYTIKRIDFDNFLLERAKESNYIQVIQDTAIVKTQRLDGGLVRLSTNSDDLIIDAELVVFCTGSNSNLINNLSSIKMKPQDISIGVRAYFEGVQLHQKQNFCEVFMIESLLPGGMYITPFTNGIVNLNVVMRSDIVKKKNINLTTVMQQIINEHPIIKERFRNAKMIGKPIGSRLYLGSTKRKISGNNFILVGDAAGLIDLLTANGIPQAMISAKIAAEEISKCIDANNFSSTQLANYDKRIHKRLENYLKLSRFVAPLISNKLFLKLTIFSMNHLAKKINRSDEFRHLIYDKNPLKKLLYPKFYYRLFFGVKNSESIIN